MATVTIRTEKTVKDDITIAAIAEGKRIAVDPNVKGYTNLSDLKEALGEIWTDELDKYRAAHKLFSKLEKAEERADKEGWISAEELEQELVVAD